MIYIYGLFDPRNYTLRYIGKSNNPDVRFRSHLSEAKKYNTRKDNWIQQLLSEDLKPSMEILEECTEDNWQEIEKAWIKEAKEKGLDLCNLSKGGEGWECGEKHPMYGRRGKEHHSYGFKHSEESKRKMSTSHKSYVTSEETKIKISKSLTGRKRSSEACRNISKGRMGCKVKPFTKEHKRKLSESHKGKTHKPHSPETKLKRSLAIKMSHAVKRNDRNKLNDLQEEYKLSFGYYNDKYFVT